jgi:hypothetical protein
VVSKLKVTLASGYQAVAVVSVDCKSLFKEVQHNCSCPTQILLTSFKEGLAEPAFVPCMSGALIFLPNSSVH